MIQRMQTAYILIGILLILGTVCFFPHSKCGVPEDNLYLFNSYAGVVFLIIFFINAMVAILKFKNRKKQIYYIDGNLIGVFGLLLILYVFELFIAQSDFTLKYSHNWMFDIGFVMGAFCFFLGRKSIKRDEDLINSINRLR